MKNNIPLISVITVSYNAVSTIEETILSVVNQTYSNIEYIIIDGGSTDGTLDIIKKYQDKIAYWISKPDKGIYDAMNKGINNANGDYLFFLGADDKLSNIGVIKDVFGNIKNSPILIYGNVKYQNGKKNICSRFSKKILLHNTIHHQSAFYHKKLFVNFRYNIYFKIVADYELNLKIYLYNKPETHYVNKVISICTDDGVSRSNAFLAQKEMLKVRRLYFNQIQNIILDIIAILKFKLHSIYKKLKNV